MPARTAFSITPKGPFSWARALDVMCRFQPLRRHARDGDSVARVAFPRDDDFEPVGVALRWEGGALVGDVTGTSEVDLVARQVARIFSLDHDASRYPEIGRRDPAVGRLMAALPGLRPVCFTTPYECAAWAILSQRISKEHAARILERFVVERGRRLDVAGATVHAFPEPEVLARVSSIPGVGEHKVGRLRELAAAALSGKLDADHLRALGEHAGPASLRSLPGIGPFWSLGIYLRACGIVDAFPDEPLSIAALGALHGLGDRPDEALVRAVTERYAPFRMWICFLLRVAAARGLVVTTPGRPAGPPSCRPPGSGSSLRSGRSSTA